MAWVLEKVYVGEVVAAEVGLEKALSVPTCIVYEVAPGTVLQLTTAGSPEHMLVWLTPMVAGAGSGVHARPASARSAWTTLRVMPLRESVMA